MTNTSHVCIAPTLKGEKLFAPFNVSYPLPFDGIIPIVEPGVECDVLGVMTMPYTKPNEPHFASIHSNPPGIPTNIPAMTVSRYGKGTVIWSAAPIEAIEYEEYRQLFLSILRHYTAMTPTFSSDAPVNVEITAFRNKNDITVNAVILCKETHSVPAQPFTIRIRTNTQPERIQKLPELAEIPFIWNDGYVEFRTEIVDIFAMYRIIL